MKNKSKVSNTTIARVVSEILSQSDPSEIFGTEGIFQAFKKQIVNNVKLLDSSNIKLPDSMEGLYKGHGSGFKNRERRAKASIKLQTLYNYSTQTISNIDILAGARSDQGYKDYLQDINPNDLLIASLSGSLCKL